MQSIGTIREAVDISASATWVSCLPPVSRGTATRSPGSTRTPSRPIWSTRAGRRSSSPAWPSSSGPPSSRAPQGRQRCRGSRRRVRAAARLRRHARTRERQPGPRLRASRLRADRRRAAQSADYKVVVIRSTMLPGLDGIGRDPGARGILRQAGRHRNSAYASIRSSCAKAARSTITTIRRRRSSAPWTSAPPRR